MKRTIAIILSVLLLLLAGCGSKRESAESVVVKAIEAVQNYDEEQTAAYWGNMNELDEDEDDNVDVSDEFMKELFTKLTYEIVNSVEGETEATVTVKFTNVDSSAIFKTAFAATLTNAFAHMFDDSYTEEEQTKYLNEQLLEAIKSGDYDMVTNEAEVKLHLEDDKWVIDADNEDAVNAMLGDIKSFYESLENAFSGDEADPNKTTISTVREWLVSDIWNSGICDMSWYYEYGTSSTGETLDPDFTLQQLAKAMEKKADYDAQMAALPDEYSEISELWVKVSEQVDILYKEIQARGTEVTGNGLDTGLYNQYFDAFDDAYFELS